MRNLVLFIFALLPVDGGAHIPEIGVVGWLGLSWLFFSQFFLILYVVFEFSGLLTKLFLLAVQFLSFFLVVLIFYWLEEVLRCCSAPGFFRTGMFFLSLVASFLVPLCLINRFGGKGWKRNSCN